jgi:hypothetical protein
MTKKKEIITPEIVKTIIVNCDILINSSIEREHNRFVNLFTRYTEWISKYEINHKFTYGPITNFLQDISGKYRVGGTVEYYALTFAFPSNSYRINKPTEFNPDSFEKWFNRYKEDYKLDQIWKLTQSMSKHLTENDVLVSDIRINKSVKGFCVDFNYKNNNGVFNYRTEAIDAGGYNIQRYHYRYITKIKKVVE